MGLQVNIYGPDPKQKNIFYKMYEDVPGGLKLSRDEFKDSTKYARRGTPVEIDLSARTAKLVKTAVVYEDDGGTTSIKVKKSDNGVKHEFKAGDKIGKTIGGAAYSISSIDTSNADHDILTLSTTIGTLTAGDVLIQSNASGSSECAEKYKANGMLMSDYDIQEANVGVAVVTRGTVIEENLPYALHSKNKESLTDRFSYL